MKLGGYPSVIYRWCGVHPPFVKVASKFKGRVAVVLGGRDRDRRRLRGLLSR